MVAMRRADGVAPVLDLETLVAGLIAARAAQAVYRRGPDERPAAVATTVRLPGAVRRFDEDQAQGLGGLSLQGVLALTLTAVMEATLAQVPGEGGPVAGVGEAVAAALGRGGGV